MSARDDVERPTAEGAASDPAVLADQLERVDGAGAVERDRLDAELAKSGHERRQIESLMGLPPAIEGLPGLLRDWHAVLVVEAYTQRILSRQLLDADAARHAEHSPVREALKALSDEIRRDKAVLRERALELLGEEEVG